MSEKLWGGRFEKSTDEMINEFQASINFDNRMYREDIQGSIAHAKMLAAQKNMSVPAELFPRCPKCGEIMTTNLRADDKFVEDEGWHAAAARYRQFLEKYLLDEIVYLELGVGGNTPGIIKYPFWNFTAENPKARYICVNKGEAVAPKEIAAQSFLIDADIKDFLMNV